jgi:hypothetical protein
MHGNISAARVWVLLRGGDIMLVVEHMEVGRGSPPVGRGSEHIRGPANSAVIEHPGRAAGNTALLSAPLCSPLSTLPFVQFSQPHTLLSSALCCSLPHTLFSAPCPTPCPLPHTCSLPLAPHPGPCPTFCSPLWPAGWGPVSLPSGPFSARWPLSRTLPSVLPVLSLLSHAGWGPNGRNKQRP